ncbi:MAG TPA: hypothetical protein VNY36_06790, partial [Bacteroidia bacterium]|nr:hypothetical protein [Bacteroidia bacterium]
MKNTNVMRIFSIVVLGTVLLFSGCNNGDKQKIKDLSYEDSVLNGKTHAQDSSIMAYVKSFNDIQDNLDSIKAKAKLLTINSGEGMNQKDQIISDMRA